MVGGGGGGGEVVELEDAVKLLVEHLVRPVLPRGALKRESNLSPEKQETVARQVSSLGEAGVKSLREFLMYLLLPGREFLVNLGI